MLHYLVLVLFVFLLIKNYEKTVVAIAAMACWLTIFKDPLKTVDNLFLTLSLISVLIGIVKYNKDKIYKQPFFWCIIPIFISYTFTMYYNGFHTKRYVVIFAQYLFPCILYIVLKKRNSNIDYYFRFMMNFLVFAALYCLLEEVSRQNPIMYWSANNQDSFTWLCERTEIRFGLKRAQSFFADVAPFGTTCAYAFLIVFILNKDKNILMRRGYRRLLLFLLPLCVFMTGTRSIILCFIIACAAILTKDTIKKYKMHFLLLGFVLFLFLSQYLVAIYDSIFSDSQSVAGSSSEMREGQWEIAAYYMLQNYWPGNGIGFTAELVESNMKGLYGAEGMWLPIMIDRGMMGVICTLIAFIIGLFTIIKHKKKNFIWIWVSFLALKTITTGVGVEPTYYEIILVVLFCYYERKGEIKLVTK